MDFIAKKIKEIRKSKGLTQEELAEQAKINLRTIQRIESSESEPRGKTLNLICEVLEIDSEELILSEDSTQVKNLGTKIINALFLVAFNLILMGIIGFLTLDSFANRNSRFGGYLLSIFLPLFIVMMTKNMSGKERMLKFGFGYIIYFIVLMTKNGLSKGFTIGFPIGFSTGLFPCLLISLSVLYFGNKLIEKFE